MEEIWLKYRYQISIFLVGLSLFLVGLLIFSKNVFKNDSIEIIENDIANEELSNNRLIIVEISGSVNSPGVYEFDENSRINDLIQKAGGFSDDANIDWIEKFVNKAAKLIDGQKIYIPNNDEQTESLSANFSSSFDNSESSVLGTQTKAVNINTATQSQLEELWGIGPVTAQNIIEQRPYSSIEELLTKKIIKQNVFDRNKDLLSVY